MIRLLLFAQVIFLYSCITYKTIHHFAKTKELKIKRVPNISFFNSKIEIDTVQQKGLKDAVYLLYDKDNLVFVSTENKIANNDFIYKINNRDTDILMTRATILVRYYTVDTLVFGHNFAIEKRSDYSADYKQFVQFYFTEYRFKNDSLIISSYQHPEDLLSIDLYEKNVTAAREKLGKPNDIRSYLKEDKMTFFRKHIR